MNTWKSKIPAIFAEQGDILEVPLDTQTDNQVSFETGYTANYERDAQDALGNPLVQYGIERTKFNYLMKVITSALKEIQEVIPTAEISSTDKIDIANIITETNTFDVLESILCIDNATGKASKITKEDIIQNLNPNVDLSNTNISVSQLATTAMNNFLTIDGDIVKKADKLLQEAIAEIDLSADNVVVSASATADIVDTVLITNTDGKIAKAATIPQEKIEEINLSKDNIAIDEYVDQEPDSVFKPVITSDTGSVYRKDKLPKEMIESIEFSQIEDNVFAKAINNIVMTVHTYPDGLDNLIQSGNYHLVGYDEYKDIINDQIDTTEKEQYILSVANTFLTNLKIIETPFTTFRDLAEYASTDFMNPYLPIIQVIGVSSGGTDDTNVTQIFKLNENIIGQRTFTATTTGLIDDKWSVVTPNIRDVIIEEFIEFMYDGDENLAQSDLELMEKFKTVAYNNNNELVYAIKFMGTDYSNVLTIDTDLESEDVTDSCNIGTGENAAYKKVIAYKGSLIDYLTDTTVLKENKKVINSPSELRGNHIVFVKDRALGVKYILFLDTFNSSGWFLENNTGDFQPASGPFFALGFSGLIYISQYLFGLEKNFNSSTLYFKNWNQDCQKITYTRNSYKALTLQDHLHVGFENNVDLSTSALSVDKNKMDINVPVTSYNDINVDGNLMSYTGVKINSSTYPEHKHTVNDVIVPKISLTTTEAQFNIPTTIDSDLTVTGNLQADNFTLSDNLTASDITVDNLTATNFTMDDTILFDKPFPNSNDSFSINIKSDFFLEQFVTTVDNDTRATALQYAPIARIMNTADGAKDIGSLNFAYAKSAAGTEYCNARLECFTTIGATEFPSVTLRSASIKIADNPIFTSHIDYHALNHRFQGNIYFNGQIQSTPSTVADLSATDQPGSMGTEQAASVLVNTAMAANPSIAQNTSQVESGLTFRHISNVATDPYLAETNYCTKKLIASLDTGEVSSSYSEQKLFNTMSNISGYLITFKGIEASGVFSELLITKDIYGNYKMFTRFCSSGTNTVFKEV